MKNFLVINKNNSNIIFKTNDLDFAKRETDENCDIYCHIEHTGIENLAERIQNQQREIESLENQLSEYEENRQ